MQAVLDQLSGVQKNGSGWTARCPVRTHGKGRGDVEPSLSVSEGDDGLLQRFQVLVWPDAPRSWQNVDRWPDTGAKNRAFGVFEKLDALDAEDFGAVAVDEGSIPAVRFTPEAQEIFDRWREKLEPRLRSGELTAPLEAHLAKYRSLMPSLALVFQVVEYVSGSAERGCVEPEAARQAVAWCSYLESHAHRLYASAESPELAGARALLEKIEAGEVEDGSTLRSVYRNQWAKLTTPEAASAAANVLADHGWIRVETLKTGGRSTTRLVLHPSLRGET